MFLENRYIWDFTKICCFKVTLACRVQELRRFYLMTSQDPISCEDNNPIANLNFNRSDYFIHFFTISPIPLICLFSLYQSISAGAKSLEDIGTWGVGLYFIFSWILYPVSFLAIQFMASRKMNLRKTSEKATSRITYKYFSVLVGYLLAIPLSPIGFTTISHIKQYQALKAQAKAKAMQEAKDKAKDVAESEAKAEDETEAKADAAAQSPAKAETAAPANSEADAQAHTQADDTLQSSQDKVAPDTSTQSTTANSTEGQK